MSDDPFDIDVTGWHVDFRGGPMDGVVHSARGGQDKRSMAAGITVSTALARGIGSSGKFTPDGLFKGGYRYEVVTIDPSAKLVTVELRPYR